MLKKNKMGFLVPSITLVLLLPALISVGSAQVVRAQPKEPAKAPIRTDVAEAMDRLKQGNSFAADSYILAKAGAVEAIPDLKKNFALTKDQVDKYAIASALVKLGDKDLTWWDFLDKGAADAISSTAPSPAGYDSTGKALPDPSPEFVAWAKAQKLTEEAAENEVFLNFCRVQALGASGDQRAIPLLRQALLSPYYLIQFVAGYGLARLEDTDSIPLIVEACRRARPEEASAIAASLLEFQDLKAHAAAKEFPLSKAAK